MTMAPVLSLLVIAAWLVFAVVVLVWGTALFVRLLGERECLPPGSFAPWILATAALACALGWHLRGQGAFALLAVFAIPILAALLRSLRLRLAERQARKKDFGWSGERCVRLQDRVELKPTYATSNAAYECTGPAGGYCLYSLSLHDASGAIATNGYVHERSLLEDIDRAIRTGCEFLDAEIVWQASPTILYSCHLKPWSDTLCGRPETLPTECAAFWRQWVRPHFPVDGSVEVSTADMKTHAEPLLSAQPQHAERLRALLDMAGPKARIMTARARRTLEESIRGAGGRLILEFERGVGKVTLIPSSGRRP